MSEPDVASQIEAQFNILKSNPSHFYSKVKFALQKIGAPAVECVLEWLKDEDEEIRKFTTSFLSSFKDRRAIEPLVKLGLKDKSQEVRSWTGGALGKFRDPSTVAPMLEALIAEDGAVIYGIAQTLRAMDVLEAIPLILQAIEFLEHTSNQEALNSAFGTLRMFPITQETYLEKLLRFYQNGSPNLKTNARDILISTNYYNYVLDDYLKSLSEEPSARTRRQIVSNLVSIPDKRVLSALTKCLKDRVATVRYEAAEVLGKIGDASVLEALEEIRFRDNVGVGCGVESAGDVATESIREIRWRLGWDGSWLEALSNSELTSKLFDEDWLVRERAANLLGERKVITAVESLIEALRTDSDADVRIAIAEALGLLQDDRAVEPLIEELNRYHRHTCWTVARVLGELGNELAIEPLALAVVETTDADPDAFSLRPFGEKAIPYLLRMLKSPNSSAREAAARLLYSYREKPEIIEALLQVLSAENESYYVKAQIASTLMFVDYPYSLDLLFELLEEPNDKIKEFAVRALGRSNYEHSAIQLVELLRNPVISYWLKVTIIGVLGKLGGQQAVKGIIGQLDAYYPQVQEAAIKALEKLKDVELAVPALIKMLENGDSQRRQLAIKALAEIGDESALPALEYVYAHDKGTFSISERVKDIAGIAIATIKTKNSQKN